jgi:DNA polymerase-3 subunit epsilon
LNVLFFDCETTGKALMKSPPSDPEQPRIVQLAAILANPNREVVAKMSVLVRPCGWVVPEGAAAIHGFTTETCALYGLPIKRVLGVFDGLATTAERLVAHNIAFDALVAESEYSRLSIPFPERERHCTMLSSQAVCKLPGQYGDYKWPKLAETYRFLFGEDFEGAHDALADVEATMRCYYRLVDDAAKSAPEEKDPFVAGVDHFAASETKRKTDIAEAKTCQFYQPCPNLVGDDDKSECVTFGFHKAYCSAHVKICRRKGEHGYAPALETAGAA